MTGIEELFVASVLFIIFEDQSKCSFGLYDFKIAENRQCDNRTQLVDSSYTVMEWKLNFRGENICSASILATTSK